MSGPELFSLGREVILLIVAVTVFLYGLKWRQDAMEKRANEKFEQIIKMIESYDERTFAAIAEIKQAVASVEHDMRHADNYIGAILHKLVTDVEVLKYRVDQHDQWSGKPSNPRMQATRDRELPDPPEWMNRVPMRQTGVESTGRHAAYDPNRDRPPETPYGPPPAPPPRPERKK